MSINLLPQESARDGLRPVAARRNRPCGIDPPRVTVEITETRLLADEVRGSEAPRLRETGHSDRGRRFRHRLCELALSESACPSTSSKSTAAWSATSSAVRATGSLLRALIQLARELGPQGYRRGGRKHQPARLLAEWGCELYQGFLGAGALTQEELMALRRAPAKSRQPERSRRLPSCSPATATRASPRDNWTAPSSRASGVGQSRETIILLSGRSFAAPFSRST